MLKNLTTFALIITALSSIASSAVIGYNEYLEANGGQAYIPQSEDTSGELGDFNGSRIIGASSDKVKLSKGQISGGFLTYRLEFDLSQNYLPGGGEPQYLTADQIDTSSAMNLTLSLTDVDFLAVTGSGRLYGETMDITFRADSYDAQNPRTWSLNQESYLQYRSDGGTQTNNTQAEYIINLFDAITGLSTEEINAMLADMKFYIDVKLTSYTERTASGTGLYKSTKEYLGDYSAEGDGVGGSNLTAGNELTFQTLEIVPADVPVPEPLTSSLLVVGAIAFIRRRKA